MKEKNNAPPPESPDTKGFEEMRPLSDPATTARLKRERKVCAVTHEVCVCPLLCTMRTESCWCLVNCDEEELRTRLRNRKPVGKKLNYDNREEWIRQTIIRFCNRLMKYHEQYLRAVAGTNIYPPNNVYTRILRGALAGPMREHTFKEMEWGLPTHIQ